MYDVEGGERHANLGICRKRSRSLDGLPLGRYKPSALPRLRKLRSCALWQLRHRQSVRRTQAERSVQSPCERDYQLAPALSLTRPEAPSLAARHGQFLFAAPGARKPYHVALVHNLSYIPSFRFFSTYHTACSPPSLFLTHTKSSYPEIPNNCLSVILLRPQNL